MAEKSTTFGIIALIVGILAAIFFLVPILNLVLALMALIFGVVQMKRKSTGAAIIGSIFGGLVLVFAIVQIVFVVIAIKNVATLFEDGSFEDTVEEKLQQKLMENIENIDEDELEKILNDKFSDELNQEDQNNEEDTYVYPYQEVVDTEFDFMGTVNQPMTLEVYQRIKIPEKDIIVEVREIRVSSVVLLVKKDLDSRELILYEGITPSRTFDSLFELSNIQRDRVHLTVK